MKTLAIPEKLMTKRNDVSVKIDAEVAADAKLVAGFEGVPFAQFLSDVLRPIIDKKLEEHAEGILRRKRKGKGKGGSSESTPS